METLKAIREKYKAAQHKLNDLIPKKPDGSMDFLTEERPSEETLQKLDALKEEMAHWSAQEELYYKVNDLTNKETAAETADKLNISLDEAEDTQLLQREAVGAYYKFGDKAFTQKCVGVSDRHREILNGMFGDPKMEIKTSDAEPAKTIPPVVASGIVSRLGKGNVIRRESNVSTAESGQTRRMTTQDGTGTDAAGKAEGADAAESDISFDVREASFAVITSGLMGQSLEFFNDTALADLETEFVNEGARRIARTERKIMGEVTDNAGEFANLVGFTKDSSQGATTAANNAVTARDLHNLYFNIDEEHRDNFVWMVSTNLLATLATLSTSQGYPLVQPGNYAGRTVSMFMGAPFLELPELPAFAASSVSIYAGNWRDNFRIWDVPLFMSTYRFGPENSEARATNLTRAVLLTTRVGFRLWSPSGAGSAIRHMATAA